MSFTAEETSLRRAWVAQLNREHEWICWGYRVKLKNPIIEISGSRSQWGLWVPDYRTIRLSSDLIKEHPWDVVINILKHEMAHQVVSEIFLSLDGHGDMFQRACRMIGLPREFWGASGDIPRKLTDFREEASRSPKARALEKVRKLLSLAQSNNENEAFLAMKKANELIEKYNIERLGQEGNSRYVHAIINHKKKRIENYQRSIGLILKDYFFVEVIYSYFYDAHCCETHRTIEILGAVENVLMAEYVYYFLLNQLEVLWKNHRKETGYPGHRKKRSYWLGLLKGFGDKLAGLEKGRQAVVKRDNDESKTTSALICAQDKMLTHYKKMRFPRLENLRSQGATLDRRSYETGISDGKRITIHRGITQKGGFQGRLLSSQ